MKVIKPFVYALAVALVVPMLQGCLYVVGGAVVATGTYGTVSYASNALLTTQKIPLEKAWTLANGSLAELKMPVTYMKKDAKSAKLKSHNAQNQLVVISLASKSDNETEIQISVGTFDTEANRASEQQIYDKMHLR